MRILLTGLRTLIGIVLAALVWMILVFSMPWIDGHAQFHLAQALAPGIAGGFICALLAPEEKYTTALAAGAFLALGLTGVMLHFELTPEGGLSWLTWYWPIWLLPAFAVGASLVRRN